MKKLLAVSILFALPIFVATGLSLSAGPEDVIMDYTRALFSRDFQRAYQFISREDQALKGPGGSAEIAL